jgi:hypothetical protein
VSIWVPPRVSAELRASTLEHQAQVMGQARRDAMLDWWTGELQKIDPKLSMIKARDDCDVAGMRAGYYHVLRIEPGAPASLFIIEGPDGEFMEPNSSVFDMLRRNDLWRREAVADRKRMQREAREAADKRRERERQARLEELRERVRAVTETSVSMHKGERPWTQTAKAQRG